MNGRIYDNWTPEDFQRANGLNLKRKLVAFSMVRKGDRPDADLMRFLVLMRNVAGSDWAKARNAAVLSEDCVALESSITWQLGLEGA